MRIVGNGKDLPHRADHARPVAVRSAFQDGVQPVLRLQRLAHGGERRLSPNNAPAALTRREAVIGIDGLMGPMERAEPEMDDPDRDGGPVVGRLWMPAAAPRAAIGPAGSCSFIMGNGPLARGPTGAAAHPRAPAAATGAAARSAGRRPGRRARRESRSRRPARRRW